ncbi:MULTISPECIES: EamA family transporter [unclassified Azospirillum]|uniref:EamA family transporter n=1 Tax=unclassified Azospirillum TaxID=2630922 RepID=UPI000B687421|nr:MULTISPECIES: EamA family transporter [unclassified Azospirillum]SNS80896.1 O-acetylserine/cysteine efflux transporter [Azospirillum sp. RU38E]SNS97979.1 O-acetylserine/cysteine efflux transporter [Azospirillum sp. RU37A]
MRPVHIALALLVALIWGVNFVFIKMALTGFPPLLLTAARFTLAALPILIIPKPPQLRWRDLALVSSFLFIGHYAFLFSALDNGMAPGLASILLQSQAFITMMLALPVLGERPGGRQLAGACIAAAGLAVTAGTIGGDVTWIGFGLTLLAAASWAMGNVLTRRLPPTPTLPLMVWLSVVPPLPALCLSLAIEGPGRVAEALSHFNGVAVASLLYIVVLSTLTAFGIWGFLLKTYRAGLVAPFSLMVPVFGTVTAHLVYGESFGPQRMAGMALIFIGILVPSLPLARLFGRRAALP